MTPQTVRESLGRISRLADVDIAQIALDVVDSVRYRSTSSISTKVMGIDCRGLRTPHPSRVLEQADQLLLLGVNTDDWPTHGFKRAPLFLQVTKLCIPVRVLARFQTFAIAFRANVLLVEQLTERFATEWIPLIRQRLLEAGQAPPDPTRTTGRVSCNIVADQVG